jgi:Na+/H+ antiporter NhaD/arsenite permease-like protein
MEHSAASHHGSDKPLLIGIAVVLALYALSFSFGWPQEATHMIAAEEEHEAVPGESAAGGAAPAPTGSTPQVEHPPYWMVLPFAVLLGAIAVLPLVPWTEHWWDNNLNRFYVAAMLGGATLLYYLLFHAHAVVGHWPAHNIALPSPVGPNAATTWAVFANAILGEYIPFIMLLFSLYTISGGIRIQGDLPAHPKTNTLFIGAGAVLASFIGTTGAAMLLIRPLLETNRERKHVKHTVIFFIFAVCNCGGCLLPIGDPPLFLGYLRGVPFLWTFALWKEWLFVNGVLLGIYYVWDRVYFYPHEQLRDIRLDEARVRGLKFLGLWPNVLLLAAVVFSVALLDPSKPLPGTAWHPWIYLREIVQLGLVGLSLLLGSQVVRRENNFSYHAIIEVAALFFGIFICMQAPLQILNIKGPTLGLDAPWHFFWTTGSLSSVLDNAPTYVVFFETANSLSHHAGPGILQLIGGEFVREDLLVGVSLGAVFMGAMTYIGNGPNFMVKAIAEKSGIRMPSFFGYMVYSCLILLPLFVITTLVFLH